MVIAAPIVATVGVLVIYGILQPTHRGPAATFWNRGREALLPTLDRLARRLRLGYAAYELHAGEYAGRIDAPVEDVDELLAACGFERMPLSAWKTLPDGRTEAASWARRDGPLAERQLHVMLFRTDGGATDIYAHDEYNAFHPRHATKHYHGIGYCPQTGCEQLQDLLGEYLETPDAMPTGDSDRHTSDPLDDPDGRVPDFSAADDTDQQTTDVSGTDDPERQDPEPI